MSELNYASALAALDDDFASASAQTGSGNLPIGRYNAILKEAKIVARSNNGIALSVSFVVTEHQHSTSDGATALPTSHRHKYVGIKKVKIHNALLEGDVVVLARIQKGKRYVVLDRISPIPELKGEWL